MRNIVFLFTPEYLNPEEMEEIIQGGGENQKPMQDRDE
jgi:hypothetical protein